MTKKYINLKRLLNPIHHADYRDYFFIDINYFEAKKLFKLQMIQNSFNRTIARWKYSKKRAKENSDEGRYYLKVKVVGSSTNWIKLLKKKLKENK